MEKKIFVGSTKPDTYALKALPITLEIELKEKSGMEHFKTVDLTPITPRALCLCISGSIGSQIGGQIDEELKKLLAQENIDYRPGWDAHILALLIQIWEQWHLNNMRAGCRHQNESGGEKAISPCPQCGYKYGSAWLFDALPPEVMGFINCIEESTPADFEDADKGNIRGFVKAHGITADVKHVDENKNAPDWKDANHYKVTLHHQGRQMTTYFSQGTGIEDVATAADVLNSLAQDARTLKDYPDPFEWAENLGMEANKKTSRIFKATQKNTEALDKLLGPVLMRELLEAEEL